MSVTGRNLADLDTPLLYGTDLQPGDFVSLGSVHVTRKEIVEFATRYDPLPMHTDPTAAAAGRFGDVIAPAALLLALFSSLASPLFIARLAIIAGKGIERLRIPTPAPAGSTLRGHVAIDDLIDRGELTDVWFSATFIDDHGRTVLAFAAISTVVSLRPAPHAPEA